MSEKRPTRKHLEQELYDDVARYVRQVGQDFTESGERAGRGLAQVIDKGEYLEGVPRVVLGGRGNDGCRASHAARSGRANGRGHIRPPPIKTRSRNLPSHKLRKHPFP